MKIKIVLDKIGIAPFSGYKNITSVTFEEGITRISGNLLRYCTGIKEITIPNSVTEIQTDAFKSCSSLEKITILDNVTEISSSAFNNHNENLTIYCYKDSYVDEWVKDHNSKNDCPIKVVYLTKPAKDEDTKQEEKTAEEDKNNNKPTNTNTPSNDNTVAPGTLPKTGLGMGLALFITIAIVFGIYTHRKYNDLKDIK